MASSFINSSVIIQIEGEDVADDFIGDLLQVSVEESLHLPSMFILVINNPYISGYGADEPWQYNDLIQIGNDIRIGFQTTTDDGDTVDTYILDGEITGVETHFTPESNAPIVVRGYDVSHRLHRGRYNRSFTDKKDSDIVREIVEELGISIAQVQETSEIHEYTCQQNQTNMEFIRLIAARNGFELFVQDGELYFREPAEGDSVLLEWMSNLSSFRVRVTTSEQVDSVVVRGWNYNQKEEIIATVANNEVITETDEGEGSDYSNLFGNTPQMIVVDRPVASYTEAQTMAQSISNQLAGDFLCADGKSPGNLDLRVGKVVELSNMNDYNGQYYITETRHIYYQGIYNTEFAVRGLRGGNILQILSPKHRLKPSQTLMIGIVTNNRDSENLGRVKVYFPTLTDEHESAWARVVGVGAGNDRGFYNLPEINDEVLVGFEHGDINRPFVIGNLWNGQDSPPESIENVVPDDTQSNSGQVLVRNFKTTTGHEVKFVEKNIGSNEAGIYLTTNLGHQINLNDNDRSVEIITSNNQKILLDQNQINLTTSNGETIALNDSTSSITIQSLGSININTLANQSINVNAGAGTINLTGSEVAASTLLTTPILLAGQILYGAPALGIASAQNVMSTISTLQSDVETNETTIQSVQSEVDTNETAIQSLQTEVDSNEASISTLQTEVDANEASIGTLQTEIDANESSIQGLQTTTTE